MKLGDGFLPIHQPVARGLCDHRARCFAAGHASGGKTDAGIKDERHVDDVCRHALLPGHTEEQRLPRLSASSDVHAERCSGGTSYGNRNFGAFANSPSVLGFR